MTQSVNQRIEPLDSKGLADFTTLIKAYFAELNIVPEFYRHDLDITAPLKTYAPPRGGIWMAKSDKDERAVGLAAVRSLANRTCELKRFYVMPEYRRQGIGQALLDQVFQFGELREYIEILLSASPEQKAALLLCEKNGFNYCARYNDDNRAGLFLIYNFSANS